MWAMLLVVACELPICVGRVASDRVVFSLVVVGRVASDQV